MIIISILLIVFICFVLIIFMRVIISPVKKVKQKMLELKEGYIPELIHGYKQNDEAGQLISSVNLLIEHLKESVSFARAISKGNFEKEFQHDTTKDELAASLLELRNSLKKASLEQQKRKIEDNQREWASNGITKFSNILRQNNDNIEALSYELLENLVEYLDANQGGIFLINDQGESPFIELIASYAYNRRKFIKKQMEIDEGYVGTCVLEKEKIYLTEIPDDYIEITSGLGHATPKCILLMPLKFKEEIVGVLELATFNVFQNYQVNFVENVAESIANTLIAVKNSLRNEQLLLESEKQREQLRQQEEEMRQNLEEMKTTQEELSNKQNEHKHIFEALDQAVFIVEYSLDGKIISANEPFMKFMNLEKYHLKNRHHKDNLEFLDKYNHEGGYRKFWNDLLNGKIIHVFSKLIITHQMFQSTYYLKESYVPIKNEDRKVHKIVKISVDVTDTLDMNRDLGLKKS